MPTLPPGTDLSQVPISRNPNGDPPNFKDPISLATTILATGLAFAIASAFFVGLRIFTNLRLARKLWLDDCTAKSVRSKKSCRSRRLLTFILGLSLFAWILFTVYVGLASSREFGILQATSDVDTVAEYCLVRGTARHSYDIPVSFIDESYIKVYTPRTGLTLFGPAYHHITYRDLSHSLVSSPLPVGPPELRS